MKKGNGVRYNKRKNERGNIMNGKPENALKDRKFIIGEGRESVFLTRNGIFQDGTTPTFRDKDGKLWAISGHSHAGHISVFSGTNISTLKELYVAETNFKVGAAGEAFDGVRYPDGVLSRGSVWPFGLFICPVTHRFFAFFHNETGWAGHGTAYDSRGLCETPYLDSDFRHIGLMHSDDEGRTWDFDRWVLAGENVGFTEKYNPNGDVAIGQKYGVVDLGSGDFSIYVDDEFIYIFYDKIKVNMLEGCTDDIDVYVARSRRRSDGIVGDFVKFYDGAFCEAGLFGKETPIVKSLWHAKVVKLKDFGVYMMSGSPFKPKGVYRPNDGSGIIDRSVQVRTSTDLINWSDPMTVTKNGEKFGAHYCAFYPDNDTDNFDISGNRFVVQLNGNGTDVIAHKVEID